MMGEPGQKVCKECGSKVLYFTGLNGNFSVFSYNDVLIMRGPGGILCGHCALPVTGPQPLGVRSTRIGHIIMVDIMGTFMTARCNFQGVFRCNNTSSPLNLSIIFW